MAKPHYKFTDAVLKMPDLRSCRDRDADKLYELLGTLAPFGMKHWLILDLQKTINRGTAYVHSIVRNDQRFGILECSAKCPVGMYQIVRRDQ